MNGALTAARSALDDNQDTIARLLRAIHPAHLPGELAELRAAHGDTGEVLRVWYGDYGALVREAMRLTLRGYNTWIGVALRDGRRSGDAHCTRTLVIPADVDNKLWPSEQDCARIAVEAFGLQPSVAVATGGGLQTYHLLDTPLPLIDTGNAALYRSLARRLAHAICGADKRPDNISNLERVLRIPFTLNWKYQPARPVRVLWCEPDRRYSVANLEAWLDEHAPWAALDSGIAQPPAMASVRPTSDTIEDFNARYDLSALLLSHGARFAGQHGHVLHFTRPGKPTGTSATYGYHPGVLHMFSSEWIPFVAGHGYDAFETYSLLEHGGDRKAAYRAAQSMGFGLVVRHGLRLRVGTAASASTRLRLPSQRWRS